MYLHIILGVEADRAKQIKTKASVNEDPTEKLIRDLQEENEKLKAMLGGQTKMEVMKGDADDLDEAGKWFFFFSMIAF